MDFGDLETHIGFKWTESDAKVVARQLLEGLKVMHDDGIIHRDLKPANIFPILLDDRILRIKIGDFGVSKRLSKDSSTIAQTHTGSLNYMAPEVLFPSDSDGYTTAVDLWALGCVVYRMVTGGLPFPTSREVISYSLGKGAFPRQELDLLSLSNAALTFVESIVKAEPENRATAELALKSDWITSGSSGFQVTTSLESHFKDKLAPIPAPSTAATEPKSQEHQDAAAETVVTVPMSNQTSLHPTPETQMASPLTLEPIPEHTTVLL